MCRFDYAATSANFPFLNKPATNKWSMDCVVRVLCSDLGCNNSAVGGTFVGSGTTLSMSTPAGDAGANVTIRYTLDGTEPTAASPAYKAAVPLSRTTSVAAKAFVGCSASRDEQAAAATIATRLTYTRQAPAARQVS